MEGFPEDAGKFKKKFNMKKFMGLLWHWAWLIILISILAGAGAFFISWLQTPEYQATTTVMVNEAPGSTTSSDNPRNAGQIKSTYARLMIKTSILEETANRLGIKTPERLGEMISVNTVTSTQLLEVSVNSTDPVTAAMIANTLVKVFSEEIDTLHAERFAQSKLSLEEKMAEVESEIDYYTEQAQSANSQVERSDYLATAEQFREAYFSLVQLYETTRLSEAQTISSISIIEPATVPTTPVSPRIAQTTAFAAAGGGLLVMLMIALGDAINNTLQTPDDIRDYLHLPVVGMIDVSYSKSKDRLITATQPRSPVTEEYRELRENVRFALINRPLKSLIVAAPDMGKDKSSVAANLAVVFAQAGVETILIDCDLRRPSLHSYFDINNSYGLSAMLINKNEPIDDLAIAQPINQLSVIPSGKLPPNPAELLASNRMKQLLEILKTRAELLILDTPPTLTVTDAISLAHLVDGALLVVQPGKTKILAARQSIERLQRAQAHMLGVVLHPLDLKKSRYAYRQAYKSMHKKQERYFNENVLDS